MKRPVAKVFKVLALVVMGAVLMLAGLLCCLYTPWFQNAAREALVQALNNKKDTKFALGRLRVRFPIQVTLGDVLLVQHGDTMIRAGSLDADVALAPLFAGSVDVRRASLRQGRYQIGTRDSATCIVLNAGSIELEPASVRLSPLHIDVRHATMADGLVDLYINPCPPPSPPNTEPPSPLTIDAGRIDLHNFTYRMNLMPVIDSLGAHIDYARLKDGHIDLVAQTVDVKDFGGHGMNVSYITPTAEAIAATVVRPDTTTSATEPWTVRLEHVAFDSLQALYTTRGYNPLPGMDFGYIQLSDGSLTVDNFYNRATDVTVPLRLSGTERCGVHLDLDGTLKVSETALNFDNVSLSTTSGTQLTATGMMGSGDPVSDPHLPLQLTASGQAACSDLSLMFPFMRPYVAGLHRGTMLDADIDVRGNMAQLDISRLRLDVPGSLRVSASGRLAQVLDPSRLSGDIRLSGNIGDLSPWHKYLADMLGDIVVPPLSLEGDVSFGHGNFSGNIDARTQSGRLALEGSFRGNAEAYDIDLSTDRFPVNAFMPAAGIGTLTADIVARGHGFNIFSAATAADVSVDLVEMVYNGEHLRDISGNVTLADGHATVDLDSQNPSADLTLNAEGNLSRQTYDWTVSMDSRTLDLHALGLVAAPMSISGQLDATASINTRHLTRLTAKVDIPHMVYTDSLGSINITDTHARLVANDSLTNLSASNGDLYVFFSAPRTLDSLMLVPDAIGRVLASQMKERRINIDALQDVLPRFSLDIDGGTNNIATEYLSQMGVEMRHFAIEAINDTIFTLNSRAADLRMGQTRMDTISFDVAQQGNRLNYNARLRNRPGTLDEWASVDVDGYFRPGRLGIDFHQRDIKGATGFQFGAYADLNPDSTATLHMAPLDPTIGYQQWVVNEDNYVRYDFVTQHVDANLRMRSDVSSLDIYTEHAGEHAGGHHVHDNKENLIVQLSDVRIQDWITINPFAPAVTGNVSADMKINYHEGRLWANGDVALSDLVYGREKVGDFRADIDMQTSPGGVINADLGLWVNGTKSLTLKGALNDSTKTSPFNLDMTVIHLPLSTLNPFVPGIARMQGTLNGRMDVSGEMKSPRLDGYLQFDSAAVRVDMLGTTFRFPQDSVPVRDNMLRLTRYAVTACNDKPLYLSGKVDIHSLADIGVDLGLKASGIQLVDSKRAAKGAEVYGKAFADIDATARGSLSELDVRAKVQLNSGTNVTYVMPDAENVIENRSTGDMVRFVNFNDSAAVAGADSIASAGMALNLNALLTIANGTTINIDLDSKGQNKVQLISQGTLEYSQTPYEQDGRLTGRLNINSGFVRYTPPLMSEKLFNFREGSYVAFNGQMLNPQLNIHAVDRLRANVTQEGQNSRLIYFDVALGVTGSLQNMNVVFDLSTNDDVTIANELQSMSPSQRASQAMNLLLYNIYTGPGTKANANLSGNPLYSFLTSQLNSWAANTIKGVDLSFGIGQYDRTTQGVSRQTMQYSYRVSKSLFNDRFKIAVGGNYSTDTEADQSVANNLFNDISIEYTLNKSGTMYVKIFRHTGFESILEGEITSTGVGFVYRRKIRRLADMFRFRRRRRIEQTVFTPADSTPTASEVSPAASGSSLPEDKPAPDYTPVILPETTPHNDDQNSK